MSFAGMRAAALEGYMWGIRLSSSPSIYLLRRITLTLTPTHLIYLSLTLFRVMSLARGVKSLSLILEEPRHSNLALRVISSLVTVMEPCLIDS